MPISTYKKTYLDNKVGFVLRSAWFQVPNEQVTMGCHRHLR